MKRNSLCIFSALFILVAFSGCATEYERIYSNRLDIQMQRIVLQWDLFEGKISVSEYNDKFENSNKAQKEAAILGEISQNQYTPEVRQRLAEIEIGYRLRLLKLQEKWKKKLAGKSKEQVMNRMQELAGDSQRRYSIDQLRKAVGEWVAEQK